MVKREMSFKEKVSPQQMADKDRSQKLTLSLWFRWTKNVFTDLTNFSTKYLVMCKIYTDVGGIK